MVKTLANATYNFLRKNKEGFSGAYGGQQQADMSSSDALLYFVLLIVFLLLLSYIFQIFWNNFITNKLGAKEVTYMEAFVMYFMFNLLF
jgi:hypothetical protein